jgi:hypothetical protein
VEQYTPAIMPLPSNTSGVGMRHGMPLFSNPYLRPCMSILDGACGGALLQRALERPALLQRITGHTRHYRRDGDPSTTWAPHPGALFGQAFVEAIALAPA